MLLFAAFNMSYFNCNYSCYNFIKYSVILLFWIFLCALLVRMTVFENHYSHSKTMFGITNRFSKFRILDINFLLELCRID